MNVFATRLSELINARGVSSSMLAQRIGCTKESINVWIRGERMPNGAYIAKMARALDVSLDYLTGLTDENRSLSGHDTKPPLYRDTTRLRRMCKPDYTAFICEKCLYEYPMGVYPGMVSYCIRCGRRVLNGARLTRGTVV